MGISTPSLVTVAANDVDTADLGVGNAAQQMVSQIGAVAGIQTLSATVASETTGAFALAYALGGAFAVLGVVAAARIRRTGSREVLSIARAA
jgi:hypothetical protein